MLDIHGTAEYHGRYGVLIHDLYADVRLFLSLIRGDFLHDGFSCSFGLWCHLLDVPDQDEQSLLQT
jgi:hypothetical protein